MQVNWEFTGCEESDEARFEQLWHDRQLQLEAKGSNWEDPSSQLLIAIEYDRDANEWRAQTVLYLADRTVATEQTATDADILMDNIIGALSQEIDLETDSSADVPCERIQLAEELVGALGELREKNQSRGFMARLSPIFQRLGCYAEQEIRVRQRLGELKAEQIETRDILDEALLRAWDRFRKRPRGTPLDLWLLSLIGELIDELGGSVAEQSLEDDVPLPTSEPQPSETDQWTEHVSYPETIQFAELLPGEPGIEALDEVDVATHRTRLTELLGTLPRSQRQALLLLTNYGYNEQQIADFQSRPSEEVRQDLSSAREALRRELEERDWWDAQERFDKATIRRKQQIQPGSRKS